MWRRKGLVHHFQQPRYSQSTDSPDHNPFIRDNSEDRKPGEMKGTFLGALVSLPRER